MIILFLLHTPIHREDTNILADFYEAQLQHHAFSAMIASKPKSAS